jgi:MFS transporter, DHA1 family, inner membrane transport protein
MPLALYALALAAFAVGTTEFIIAGLLPTLAADLGVSIPATGLLVTGYALGVALGGPILALMTSHWPRRPVIIAMVALYAAGHVLCAVAPNYTVLLIARILVALTHGLFFGNATIAAAMVVAPERRGAAISVVLAGVPLANLLGVPFGAVIGHALGWRSTFWIIAAISAVAAIAIALTLPKVQDDKTAPVPWRDQLRVLARHQISLSYTALFLLLIGLLAFNTFQVPFLIEMTGISEGNTPPYLFAYGAGAVIGIFLGGRLSDWKLMPTLLGSIGAYTLISALILLITGSPVGMFIAMLLMGIAVCTFQIQPQARIVANSAGAPTLAATFIATAFNLGYAVGALAGAGLLSAGFGYVSLPVVGIVCGLLAGAVSLWSWGLDKPA